MVSTRNADDGLPGQDRTGLPAQTSSRYNCRFYLSYNFVAGVSAATTTTNHIVFC